MRSGSGLSFHQLDKPIEQRCHIMRPRTGFRVSLEAERRAVRALNPLQGAIEQRFVSCTQRIGQRLFIL